MHDIQCLFYIFRSPLLPLHATSEYRNTKDMDYALITILSIYIILGVPGNILVIVSIICKKQFRKPADMYILCMAGSDLIVCAVSTPFHIYTLYVKQETSPCVSISAVTLVALTSSGMTLTAIAVNRWLLITWSPNHYQKAYSPLRTSLSILTIMCLSVIVCFPVWTYITPSGYNKDLGFCLAITVEQHHTRITVYTIFISLFIAFPAVIVTSLCYLAVWLKFKKSTNTIHTEESPSDKNILRKCKLSRNLFFLTVIFAICVIPQCVIDIILNFQSVSFHWLKITYLLVQGISVINPFLYAFLNKKYFDAYKRIIRCDCTFGKIVTVTGVQNASKNA